MLAAWVLAGPTVASAERCDDDDLNRILAPAQPGDDDAVVDCDLELTPLLAAAITRRLSFVGSASSGVTLDCGGGTVGSSDAPARIRIAPRRIGSSPIPGVGIWEPVSDMTIRDCELQGSVRIVSIGVGGDGADELTQSSHFPLGHVARVRAAAPRRITLDDVTLVGVGPIPFYVSAGTQDTTVVRSRITGWSRDVAIYLDSESRGTTIRDCTIDIVSRRREVLAIDGSEENRIIGNTFFNLERGGVYLYRNCGEHGFVRMTPAQRNEIIDNVFHYDGYVGPNPGVFLGSDGGFATHRFCHNDLEYPYGSGADDRDHTARNVVMQNQFVGRSADDMIHTEWPETNRPNYVDFNATVTDPVSRSSGCFTRADHEPRFLLHGESTTLAWDPDGHPYEHPVEATCVDGDLVYASAPQLRSVREVPFGCSISGDNGGCRDEVRCADGEVLVGARAACNLEHGRVHDAQLATVPRDALWVLRWSDVPQAGRCWIGDLGGAAGEIALGGRVRGTRVEIGCREHDRNGGDCEIRGVAYCAAAPAL